MKKQFITQLFWSAMCFIVLYLFIGIVFTSLANASDISDAKFKKEAKECYQQLTKGKYISEEFNLSAIDYCVNRKIKK